MNPLFSKSSLMILESLSFTKSIYAFDYDGTLSRIVRKPEDASTTETTDILLGKLSEFVPIAIISGRSLKDLKQRLKVKPHYIVGNHGLEGLGKSKESILQAQVECDLWKKKLLNINLGSGVEVEDKAYSLAIHYRRSRSKKIAKQRIHAVLSTLDPVPRIVLGKSVVNLLPVGAPHKGAALLELMNQARMKHAFYIGDDDTDEDVFGLTDARIMTVRVGYKKTSRAQFYIERQSQINDLLRKMIRFHEKENSKYG